MRAFLALGALFGLLGVCLGAFAAHVLHGSLAPRMVSVFHTAVNYQFYHAFALMAVGLLLGLWPNSRLLYWAGALFAVGIVLFCGSLYIVVVGGVRWLGAVTPVGGMSLIAGWAVLLWACLRGSER